MARKKKSEDHENLERWLVSYADFITLLFAFFVVMYSISSVNEGKYKTLSSSLVNAFKNMPETIKPDTNPPGQPSRQFIGIRNDGRTDPLQRQHAEKMQVIAKDLFKVMEPLVREGQVKVTQNALGVAVEINASVLFGSGEAALAPASIKVLKAVSQVLAQVPNNIQIEGFTDNTPINTVAYPSNWELSTARASSVVRLFIENGVYPSRLVAVGYAENRPIESNETPEGRTRNRRVTVMILSEASQNISVLPLASAKAIGISESQAGNRR